MNVSAAPLAHVTMQGTNSNELRIGPFSKSDGYTMVVDLKLSSDPAEGTTVKADTLEHALVGAKFLLDEHARASDLRGVKGELLAALVQTGDGAYQLTEPVQLVGLGTANRTWWGNDCFEGALTVRDARSDVKAILATDLDPVIVGADGTGSSTTVID